MTGHAANEGVTFLEGDTGSVDFSQSVNDSGDRIWTCTFGPGLGLFGPPIPGEFHGGPLWTYGTEYFSLQDWAHLWIGPH